MTPLSQKPSVGESVGGALLRLDGVHQHPRAERHLVCRRVVAGLEEVGGLEHRVRLLGAPVAVVLASDFERISADFDAILGGILAIFSRSGLANSLGRREGSR